ncbi:MAG: radical SAM protein, partial [Clostridium sp.]|nr:radical SAM protein [Clostridium sp.]
MRYEGAVYRPPSEAYSLIIQVTLGCSHNKCTFCNMYKDKKFKIRKLNDIFEDLEMAREYYKTVKRVFLADGDALILKTEDLEAILIKIKELFPECNRIGIYGTPKDILRKSEEDLIKLRDLGLDIIYLGIESGSDVILKDVKKGVTASEMIEAGKKVK